MKPLALLLLFIAFPSFCALGQSPVGAGAFIDARQPEVEQLGEIFYRVHLEDGKWTRLKIEGCEVFAHRAFATFKATPANGSPVYIAIYDLDHAPAKSLSKAWQGGVKLFPGTPDQGPLLTAFNFAITQENAKRVSEKRHELDSLSVADCFIRLSGEQRAMAASVGDASKEVAAPTAISSVLIPLSSASGSIRTEIVDFDAKGLITKATVTVQREP